MDNLKIGQALYKQNGDSIKKVIISTKTTKESTSGTYYSIGFQEERYEMGINPMDITSNDLYLTFEDAIDGMIAKQKKLVNEEIDRIKNLKLEE